MSTIAPAVVTGIFSIIVALIAAFGVGRSVVHQMEISQAVTDTKITELTREVREHNGFAKRMPVVEEQIKVINHRIEDLENDGK